MKNSPLYIILSLCLLAGLASITAEPDAGKSPSDEAAEEADDLPRHVRVQIDYIEMSLTTMSALMDDEKATVTDTALRARVNELVKAGKATIIESQLLVARNGEKSTVESIQEFIYPTEYEPSELPNEIHLHTNGADTKISNHDVATGPTPTAFETRNLGATLEIEPVIDGKYIDLRVAPELVYHSKNITYAEWKGRHGRSDIVMPEIYTMRTTTAVTLLNRTPTLVSALSPKTDEGRADYSRKVLMFAKASIITVR